MYILENNYLFKLKTIKNIMLRLGGHTDIFLYELSRATIRVACEIDFYLTGKPNGTKYNHFPSSQKLIRQLESSDAKSKFREDHFYKILVPKEERRSIYSEDARKSIEDKRSSLIFTLKAIEHCNSEELKRLRDSLVSISLLAGSIATC